MSMQYKPKPLVGEKKNFQHYRCCEMEWSRQTYLPLLEDTCPICKKSVAPYLTEKV